VPQGDSNPQGSPHHLSKKSYQPSSTTPVKLTYQINGEIPLQSLPGKRENIGALNQNKQGKLD
jgi:hypothetical protein